MRCLEKDRTRRYETANGLAADVQRHLNQEPVVACPPNATYRFRKLVRRNRLAFAAITAVAAALVIGIGISSWMFLREKEARKRAVAAEEEQVRLRRNADMASTNELKLRLRAEVQEKKAETEADLLKKMLESVGPSVARGRDTEMLREILDNTTTNLSRNLTNELEIQADLLNTIGLAYWNIGKHNVAEDTFRRALTAATNAWASDHPITASILHNLADTLRRWSGTNLVEAEARERQALEMNRRL
jgi:tetratricopeptide (TPR) repeat protein